VRRLPRRSRGRIPPPPMPPSSLSLPRPKAGSSGCGGPSRIAWWQSCAWLGPPPWRGQQGAVGLPPPLQHPLQRASSGSAYRQPPPMDSNSAASPLVPTSKASGRASTAATGAIRKVEQEAEKSYQDYSAGGCVAMIRPMSEDSFSTKETAMLASGFSSRRQRPGGACSQSTVLTPQSWRRALNLSLSPDIGWRSGRPPLAWSPDYSGELSVRLPTRK